MIGQELLESVSPGFQGMIPPNQEDINPNQQPDPILNKKLGKPLGYNPVQIALNRREMINEIEKAVAQLIETALTEGMILSRPQAISKVRQIWAQRASDNQPSSTSPSPQSTPTSNQPLSEQQKQACLNRTQQNTKVSPTKLGDITPQQLTPAPGSPPPIPESLAQLEADRLANEGEAFPSTPEEHQLRADLQPRPPTVAAINRALTDRDEFAEGIQPEATEARPTVSTAVDKAIKDEKDYQLGHIAEEIESGILQKAKESNLPTHTEGPRAIPNASCTIGPETNDLDPVTDSLFTSMAEPSEPDVLSDEMQKDLEDTLHESTKPLLTFLPRRNCLQFFRQSLALVGLPQWSRWTPQMRDDVEKAYVELVSDPFEVDMVVRKLQSFSAKYGKQRLLRMCATILGIQAWMSLETIDVGT